MTREAPVFIDLVPEREDPAEATEPGRFLGRFTEASLERELDSAGLLAALADRGYPDVRLGAEVERGEHRLTVLAPGEKEALVDLRVSEVTCTASDPLMRMHGLEMLYLLAVHRLVLRNPRARFTAARPRLPGQSHPGLGIGRRIYGRLMSWAHEWGKDALVNFPRYYHNAVFYASMFRFVLPARQGRFEALRRDLAALPVSEASAVVESGRVLEEPGGTPLRWQAAETIAPVTRAMAAYLGSDDYAHAAASARDAVRYRLDR